MLKYRLLPMSERKYYIDMKKQILTGVGVIVLSMTMSTIIQAEEGNAPKDYSAYFSFDETLGNAVAVRKGTLETVLKEFIYADGKNGKSIVINADTEGEDYDDIGLDTNVRVSGEDSFSVSFWVKAYTAPFAAPVIWIGTADQTEENWIGFWAGVDNENAWNKTAGLGSNDAEGTRMGITSALSDTNAFGYDYITFTVDGNTHRGCLYYNGVEVGKTEGELPVLNEESHIYVGANAWDAPAHMEIDDLLIYKRVLTAEEVDALYRVNGNLENEVGTQEQTTMERITLQVSTDPYKGVEFVTTREYVWNKTVTTIIIVISVAMVAAIVASCMIIRRKRKKK